MTFPIANQKEYTMLKPTVDVRSTRSRAALPLAAALVWILAGCAEQASEPADGGAAAAAESPAGETPEQDPTLLKHMAAMQSRPGVTELSWRESREPVQGADEPRSPGEPGAFVAPEALEAAIAYHREHNGLGLLVWHDGKLVADDFADGFSPSQRFSTFSMHKSVLAMTIAAAVEDGIIDSFDDPIGKYVEEWSDDPRGATTLRQFLNHTSGIAHYSFTSGNPKGANLALSSKISATALSYPQDKPAGTEFNYNNVNSQLVGLALEQALADRGKRYAEYLAERLWLPLGNSAAALWIEAPGGSPRFFSGLEAGLADWLRVGLLLLNNGTIGDTTILKPESVAMLTSASDLNAAYGMHIWRGQKWQAQRRYGPTTQTTVPHEAPYLAPDVVYFDGFGGQRVYVVPSASLVVARGGEVDLTYDDSMIVNSLLRGLIDTRISEAKRQFDAGAGDEAYDRRFSRLLEEAQAGRGLAGYDSLIPLPGANEVVPLPRAAEPTPWLDSDTRGWLDAFGAGNNSSAILIWHEGEVVYENYFNGANPETLVVSRSLAKPITIMAVGRALQEGFIPSLDQPVDEVFYEWKDSDKSAMTLRHLLQMRSGLARQGNSMEPDHFLNRAYLHPYHIEVILHEYPLTHPPGTRYDYSNANSEVIAPFIERSTGRRYEQWVSEAVLEPLGAAGGEIWVNRENGITHSGCCALLPAESYLRLSVLVMNDGVWNGQRLLPEGFIDEITAATDYNPHTGMGMYVAGPYIQNRGAANPDVPFGHTLHSEPYLDKDLFLYDGNGHQVSYHIPRHNMVIMRVGVRPPKDVTWDNSELPNTILRQYADATGAELVPQEAAEQSAAAGTD